MNQRTALVVDDSRSARFALRKHLEHHAFKVDTAESAQAAYHWLESQKPDLIFLDHVMPGEDGFTALRHLKADPQTAAIPVVICSSNEGSAFVAEARSQGAADVLQKPPSPEQLKRVLQQVEAVFAAQDDNEPISVAEEETGGLSRYLEPEPAAVGTVPEPQAAPEPAPDRPPGGLDTLRAEMLRLQGDASETSESVEARISAIEARIAAMEQRLVTDLTTLRKHQDKELETLRKQHDKSAETLKRQHEKELETLRKQFDGDLRAVHRQFDETLAAGLKTAREQAVAEIRDALLRALRS